MRAVSGRSPAGRGAGLRSLLLGAICATTAWGGSVTEEPPAAPSDELVGTAARLEMRFGRKKSVRGDSISKRLSPPVRAALNRWADTAERLDLQIALGAKADCVLLAHCDKKLLGEAVDWIDDTWELLDALVPAGDGWHDAPVIFLFDREGAESPAWEQLFDELAERDHISADTARRLAADTGSVTLRDIPAAIQVTWDVAGNAAAGDDEFRLANEVAHKLTQCLLHERFGPVPETFRWGLGYVVEQRLFGEIYQFGGSGFVSADSHHDWPEKVADMLHAVRKDDSYSLAEQALEGGAGVAQHAQMVTWAALDYLLHEQPEELVALLEDLGQLHEEASPFSSGPWYEGEAEATRARLAATLDSLDTQRIRKHAKRIR